MSSNLPPGVTDRMIDDYFGPPEWVGTEDRQCGATVDTQIVTPAMRRLFIELKDGPPRAVLTTWSGLPLSGLAETTARQGWFNKTVTALMREYDTNDTIEFDCTYDGEVEVVVIGDNETWTCPGCGTEHLEPARDADLPEPEREDYEDR